MSSAENHSCEHCGAMPADHRADEEGLLGTVSRLEAAVEELTRSVADLQEERKIRKTYTSWRRQILGGGKFRRAYSGWRQNLLGLVGVQLWHFQHYPPRPLHVPPWYTAQARLQGPPLLSIVTPSFNHGRFLERTLCSVLEQDYPRLEYIVQDGGSTDETAEVLQRYQPRLKHATSAPDRGQANALNLGFRHAAGEVMAYLNSDDILLPGALHYVTAYFAAHPEIDVVYGHRVIVDADDWEIGRWVLPPHDDGVLSWADYVPQETLFWRRRIWEKAGGAMDESFRFALDWDLLLRFRKAGAKIVRLPRFLGAFRVHDAQKTSQQLAGIGEQEMKRLRLRCHGREVSPEEIGRGIRGYYLRHALYHRLYRLGMLAY